MEHHRVAVEKANRRSKAGIIAGIVGITVGIASTLYALNAHDTANDVRDLQEQYQADSAQARLSGCIQYNVQRFEIRVAVKDALLALAPPGTPLSDSQKATLERYNGEVDAKLPYRDCSPAGLEQYFKRPPEDPAVATTRG